MRKVKGKQRILAAMLCVNLALQGMSLEVFATEMDSVSESVEDFAEQETESGEIEIWTEMDTEVQEMENPTEVEEQEDDSETKTVSEIEKNSVENEIPVDEKVETDVEIESENEEIVSENAVLQEGEVLSGKCGDNLTWKIENGTLTISGTGDMWDYDVEYDYNIQRFVTTADWGEYRDILTSLILERGITSIGKGAFYDCNKLSGKLIIPNTVNSIGNDAFTDCNGFSGELILPNSLTGIGDFAFANCSGFNGGLTIPNGVVSIGEGVFQSCSGFNGELIISSNVISIGECAFVDCRGFSGKLTIPNSVKSIGFWAFSGCRGFSGELIIPNSVINIGNYAFQDCSGFSGRLTIPNSVVSIGVGSFMGCRGFSGELTIPSSVTGIGESTFADCSGFSGKLIIPSNVTSISRFAFSDCLKITDVYISETLEDILENPFQQTDYNTGGFYNLPLTFHCPKNSYAYTWAVENGFKVVEWDGITIGGDTPSDDDNTGDYGDILPEDIPTDSVIPKGLWIPNVTPKNYTGAAITPVIRVYDNNTLLTQNKDYTISYKNNIKANDAQDEKTAPTITVTGKGNYTGKETAVFQISPKDLSDEDIQIEDITLSYNKKVQKPTPILSWNGKKLKVKTDFQVQYTDSFAQAYQQVGTYKILVSGTGNFTGQKEIEITITDNKLITKMKADKIADQLYTGKQITPEITVKDGKTLLKKGKDYTLEYHNNTQIGKASVTIIGIGEYSGKKKLFFNITGGSIAKAKVSGLNAKEQYTGSEITQNCKLTVVLNGDTKTLKKDTDYTVSYANNIHAGKATIIFKGINGFSGVLKQNFTIEAFDIGSPSNSKCKITLPKTVPYVKGGSAPKPVITFNGETLCEGANYTLSYKNNKEITDKTNNTNKKSTKIPQVIVKGKGDFKGTQTLDFQITTQNISNLTLNAADKIYQKKSGAYGTKVEIVDIDGKKLSAGKDYDKDLTYTYVTDTKISDDILRKAGSAVEKEDVIPAGTMIQVSAVGKGSYKGTISGKYRITKAEISKASVKVADQTYTGNPIEPGKSELEIKIKGETLGNDCYEIVKYDTNVNKGKAFITIKGVGDYGGVKTATFKIKSKGFLWWWKK